MSHAFTRFATEAVTHARPPHAFDTALARAIGDGSVPVVALVRVLLDAPTTDPWTDTRNMALAHVAAHPELAVSVLAIGAQVLADWPEPTYTFQMHGDPHCARFQCFACLAIGGPSAEGGFVERVHGTGIGRTKHEAKQRASVDLLARVARLAVPEVEVAPAKSSPPEVTDADPIQALYHWCSRRALPVVPAFAFAIEGPPHRAEVTCHCHLHGFPHTSGKARTKQGAKRAACELMLATIRGAT